jgi:DNA-directed RNA polymerase subunit alpha
MLWKGFQKPKRLISVTEPPPTDTYAQFSAQPFERGFGTTIGNALRRVLLSSIEGAAITAVKIEGVLHEFSSIPGVVEDATDIILNLKQIPLKLHGEERKTVYLKALQPGEYRSGNIEHDPDVEILDENIYIGTVSEGGSLQIEMRVQNGRGYVSADRNFDEDLGIGYIPVDSVHSPVRKVNYYVEAARLGQVTDYDKLTIEIWTNGSISPQDALGLAAKLIKDHMQIFIQFEEKEEPVEEPTEIRHDALAEHLNKSVDELELSVRSYNCLKNANIRTIGELVTKSEAEMLKTKNFGRKSLNEIKEILAGMGLALGMKVDDHGRPVMPAQTEQTV